MGYRKEGENPMKKLIFKVNARLKYDDMERLEQDIVKSLDKYGFAIIDDTIDIYEIEVGEDDNK